MELCKPSWSWGTRVGEQIKECVPRDPRHQKTCRFNQRQHFAQDQVSESVMKRIKPNVPNIQTPQQQNVCSHWHSFLDIQSMSLNELRDSFMTWSHFFMFLEKLLQRWLWWAAANSLNCASCFVFRCSLLLLTLHLSTADNLHNRHS